MKQDVILKELERFTIARNDEPYNIIHAGNFAKLAVYLNETKIKPEKFCMNWLINSTDDRVDTSDTQPKDVKKTLTQCGTSACALGHAPLAGIKPKPGMRWGEYDKCFFVQSDADEWFHCFDACWGGTAKDAAKRIAYMLITGRVCAYVNWNEDFTRVIRYWRPSWTLIKKHVDDAAPWTITKPNPGDYCWNVCLKMKDGEVIHPPLRLSSRSAGTRSSRQG